MGEVSSGGGRKKILNVCLPAKIVLDEPWEVVWSTASTMTSWHHFHSTVTQNCTNLTQLQRCNDVRVHLYAYVNPFERC
jgi:hypothetical protein